MNSKALPVAANILSYCATIIQTNQVFQLIQLILSILGTLVLVVLKVVQVLKDGKLTDNEIDDLIDFFTGLTGDKEKPKSSKRNVDPGFIEDEVKEEVDGCDDQKA